MSIIREKKPVGLRVASLKSFARYEVVMSHEERKIIFFLDET